MLSAAEGGPNTAGSLHRRIQDFVRGGAKALLARASLFGGAIFCGEGGPRPPWPPPLDPRMHCWWVEVLSAAELGVKYCWIVVGELKCCLRQSWGPNTAGSLLVSWSVVCGRAGGQILLDRCWWVEVLSMATLGAKYCWIVVGELKCCLWQRWGPNTAGSLLVSWSVVYGRAGGQILLGHCWWVEVLSAAELVVKYCWIVVGELNCCLRQSWGPSTAGSLLVSWSVVCGRAGGQVLLDRCWWVEVLSAAELGVKYCWIIVGELKCCLWQRWGPSTAGSLLVSFTYCLQQSSGSLMNEIIILWHIPYLLPM